ncbi:capsular polysaccharide export protein [Litoreibacter ponti]|uniref:Capsular polysaccharide export protein n=1 Tax=Litoreibacter ponti TaxID=1510457 RepID=A0A2T6BKU4_9RHOB|nr:capsular biosynthesis protein [Litoreibacter ponti]PTX56684.1 capsular polysaccharide export protein [Litoreibacter ponti]
MTLSGKDKTFLFLQGPHGPFFYRLAKMLVAAGAQVWRVGFNKGDDAFWFSNKTYLPYLGTHEDWPARFAEIVAEKHVTDLVLYGDTRPIHAEAVARAEQLGLRVHVFEEGYLRPYWVSYERGGANGHSRLMQMSVGDMRAALEGLDLDLPDAPARWGDMRQHVFYGMVYHYFVFLRNWKYRNFKPHRAIGVTKEFQLYLKRLVTMPFTALDRRLATWRIKHGGFPYHLALLQLEHDASFQQHSPFETMTDFLELTIEGFATGAPTHHHLVLKAHPLEDGRVPLRREIKRIARAHGVSTRVHYVRGGKLAGLLNTARSAVTVNSTAAQQVLWRGLPLKVFGDAVYNKPEFVSTQSLPDFFTNPTRPDSRAYRDYRHYLLETSQIPGGFYSARGRRQLLRQVVDMMLAQEDPYDALTAGTATPRQQLHVVK